MTATVEVRRGSLYLPEEVCRRHLSGLAAVILQRRGADLMIMPVRHAAAGGYLMKRRNARGDRVVDAFDFFRWQGLDEEAERDAVVSWDADAAALRAEGIFDAK